MIKAIKKCLFVKGYLLTEPCQRNTIGQ